MPNYGLRYTSNFDGGPLGNEPYTLEFYLKDYDGDSTAVLMHESAVQHKWDKDEPTPGIKGSSIDIGLLNPGDLPLSTFYSSEDDTWQVIFKWREQILFKGYLVQDDCTEIDQDGLHAIQLSATDNIGLTKDISLKEASLVYGPTAVEVAETIYILPLSHHHVTISAGAFVPKVGDTFILTNASPGIDGVAYEIIAVHESGGNWVIDTSVDLLNSGLFSDVTVTWRSGYNLTGNLPLGQIVGMCLNAAGLDIAVHVYATIIEAEATTNRFLDETFVSGEYFLTGNTWLSCYEILSRILERFNATLFQSEGVWNIVRWQEQRYYSNAIVGQAYDSLMQYVVDVVYNDVFSTDLNQATYPLEGLTRSVLRPFKFVKETFNYNQPANILKNANLQNLGPLRTTYTVGSETWSEYDFPYWFVSSLYPTPPATYFIRVITSGTYNTEVTRYAVVIGPTGDDPGAIESTAIEVNAGDMIKYNFTYRTSDSNPGNVNNVFDVRVSDGTDTYYVENDGQWSTTGGYTYNVPSGDNTNQWHTVTIESREIPVDGLLYVPISKATPSSSDETQFKDISIEITYSVNESTKIIGQTHTNTQAPVIKNSDDTEIYLDDSPRNSINGTLLLATSTGQLRDRTSRWGYGPGGTRRLGEITTFEDLFARRIPRSKLEGAFKGLLKYNTSFFETDFTFLPGSANIIVMADVPPGSEYFATQITISGSANHDGDYTVIPDDPSIPVTVRVLEDVSPAGADHGTVIFTTKRHLSMLTLMRYREQEGFNFIFGTLTIDYKYNGFNGTLWEIWQEGEDDSDLASSYVFKYLYDNV